MAKGSGFSFKIKMNATNKILKDHGLDKDGRVVRYARDTADRLMAPFVPRWCRRKSGKAKNIP